MALVSRKVNKPYYSIHLKNDKFIECNPLSFNVIIPLSGEFYYIGNRIEEYDLENYDLLKPFDVLLSTAINPDFLFTLDSDTLLLVLSIEKEFFYEYFKNRIVGYHKVTDDELRSQLNVFTGNLCAMDVDNGPSDYRKVLDKIIDIFNTIIIDTDLRSETENNISIAEQFYDVLRGPDTHEKNLKDIFEGYYYSRSYVSSKFKRITNINLVDYLRLRRVTLAYNSIQKSTGEMTYLSGFRNEKIMKESLRLITGYSFKELRNLLKDSTLDNQFIKSPSFRLFLDYGNTVSAEQRPSSYGEDEDRSTFHEVKDYTPLRKMRPIWQNLGDFRLFRFEENIAYSEAKVGYFHSLKYNNYRLKLLYRNDGKFYLDLGNDSMIRVKLSTLGNMFRHFSKDSGFIISLDFLSLNYETFDDITKKGIKKIIYDIFEEKRVFDFFNIFGRETIQNLSIEFDLGDILNSSDIIEAGDRATGLLRALVQKIQNVVYRNQTDWGIHFNAVNLKNIAGVDEIMNVLGGNHLIPDFLSLSIDEKDSASGIANVEHLLYTYERILEKVSKHASTLKERWGMKVYITRFILYFNMSQLDKSLWNSFFNTVVIEGFTQSMKQVDGVGCVTISSEGKDHDFSLFSAKGFPNMLYFTILLANQAKGDIIYNENGSIVIKNDDVYYILAYALAESSYFYVQKYELLNYTWKNSIKLRDIPGTYIMTHYSLDFYHGDYNSSLKNFQNPDFLTEEEWNYIDRITVPKMTTKKITTEDDIVIETEMRPFNVHFFKLERYR